MDKNINTWRPGKTPSHLSVLSAEKRKEETLFAITRVEDEAGDLICMGKSPGAAMFIAHRLNVAADLERLLFEFYLQKSDGNELAEYVKKLVNHGG